MVVAVAVLAADGASTLPEPLVDDLRRAFPQHTFLAVRRRDELPEVLPRAQVAFASTIPKELLPALTGLKWVQAPAAGVAHLLYPEFVASSIILTNSRGVSARTIAEHVMAVTLALARQLHVAARRQADHVWAFNEISENGRSVTLLGRHMGIVGLGSIGREVALIASAFGMHVAGIRRRLDQPLPPGVERVLAPGRLDELLGWSDVVVLSTPLTAATERLIDATSIEAMKPRAMLVNVGRGKLIDDGHLVAALRAGRLGGAALDVFAPEPLPSDSPYWDLPNVIVTPHVSSAAEDYWPPVVGLFADNLRRFERGEALVNVVDKDAGY
jgi:phosphoglycerate dehydrogenase-like enzyme